MLSHRKTIGFTPQKHWLCRQLRWNSSIIPTLPTSFPSKTTNIENKNPAADLYHLPSWLILFIQNHCSRGVVNDCRKMLCRKKKLRTVCTFSWLHFCAPLCSIYWKSNSYAKKTSFLGAHWWSQEISLSMQYFYINLRIYKWTEVSLGFNLQNLSNWHQILIWRRYYWH